MIHSDWAGIKYFNKNENWGNIDKVKTELITRLDTMRAYLGSPIYLSPVKGAVYATSGHAFGSYHYTGEAGDIFPQASMYNAFIAAVQTGFTGIGLYPYWGMYKPVVILGGLHVDIRPGILKTWVRRKDNTYTTVPQAICEGVFNKPGK